jgi:effector-binding domain-containing protein
VDVTAVERTAQPVVGVREVVALVDLPQFFGRAFSAAAAELGTHGLSPVGPPVAVYEGEVGTEADVMVGFPVHDQVDVGEGVVLTVLPAGAAVEVVHVGPYDTMTDTYRELTAWFAEQGITPAGRMWEEYLVGPETTPDTSRWQTKIVWPVG